MTRLLPASISQSMMKFGARPSLRQRFIVLFLLPNGRAMINCHADCFNYFWSSSSLKIRLDRKVTVNCVLTGGFSPSTAVCSELNYFFWFISSPTFLSTTAVNGRFFTKLLWKFHAHKIHRVASCRVFRDDTGELYFRERKIENFVNTSPPFLHIITFCSQKFSLSWRSLCHVTTRSLEMKFYFKVFRRIPLRDENSQSSK